MEETVKTPGKSMEYEYFQDEFLPKIKNAPIINFMGGEPTLHPQFIDIFQNTYDAILPYSHLSVFTNGLMPDKVLDLLLKTASTSGATSKNINFAILLNWQTMENISEKNHERCKEVAERMLRVNGFSVTFSINLYSKEQELEQQCEEIDQIYQRAGLPRDKQYKIRVSPAFPIIGGEANTYLPIRDFPKVGKKMLDVMEKLPQLCFRFDCSLPPCFLDDISENQMPLTDRFYFHGNKQLPPTEEWKNNEYYFGCAD